MKRCKFKKRNVAVNVVIVGMLLSLVLLAVPVSSTAVSAKSEGVYYTGDSSVSNVAMMFNVYSGTEYIDDIIAVLAEKNVSATFFVGGCWAEKNIDTLQNIADAGYELGNHGYLHIDHETASDSRQLQEIQLCNDLVKETTGVEMTLFAPPSGAYNASTQSLASSIGYDTIMWTYDSVDWRDADSSLVYSRLTNSPENGALLLMHPTAHTLEALPDIIDFYLENNYSLTTVSECIWPTA